MRLLGCIRRFWGQTSTDEGDRYQKLSYDKDADGRESLESRYDPSFWNLLYLITKVVAVIILFNVILFLILYLILVVGNQPSPASDDIVEGQQQALREDLNPIFFYSLFLVAGLFLIFVWLSWPSKIFPSDELNLVEQKDVCLFIDDIRDEEKYV